MIPAARRFALLAAFAALAVGEASAQRMVVPRRAGPPVQSPAGWRAAGNPSALRGLSLGSVSALRPALPGAAAAPSLETGIAPAPALDLEVSAPAQAAGPQAQPLELLGNQVSDSLGAADLSRPGFSQGTGKTYRSHDRAKGAEVRAAGDVSPALSEAAVSGPLFLKGSAARPAGGDSRPPSPREAARSKRDELKGKILVGAFFGAATVSGVLLGSQAPWWASGLVFLGGGTVLGGVAALALGAVVLSVVFALVGLGVMEPKAGPVRTALAAAGLFALTAGGVGLVTAAALKTLGVLGMAPLAAAGMLRPSPCPTRRTNTRRTKAPQDFLQDKGVDPAGMKFRGSAALWRGQILDLRVPRQDGGREDVAAILYSPNAVSGFDRKELYYRGVEIRRRKMTVFSGAWIPYYFGRGSLTTPARAADAARAALPGFKAETFSLDLREEAGSGDQDLQYTFYADDGSVVRVNARTGESRLLEEPEAPRGRAVRPWEAASAMAFASLLIVGGAVALLALVIRVLVACA